MKKIIYLISIILLLTLIIFFINSDETEYTKSYKKIYNSYEILKDNIEKNVNEKEMNIKIYKGKYYIGKRQFNLNDIDVKGEFYIFNKKLYGNLQLKNICLEKSILSEKVNISKRKCSELKKPMNINQLIENEKNLKKDIEINSNNSNEQYNSKYYYIGTNPNNYIKIKDRCWRIVNITNDNYLKIVYEGETNNGNCIEVSHETSGSIGLYTWDENKEKIGNWEKQSSLKDLLYYWGKEREITNVIHKIQVDDKIFKEVNWNIGTVNKSNLNIIDDIRYEQNETTSKKNIFGLLNVSDYLKVSCRKSAGKSDKNCGENNYLYKSKYNWWTINVASDTEKTVWVIMQDGSVEDKSVKLSFEYFFSGLRLAAFLDNDVKLIGNGTPDEPYYILN